MQMEFENLTVLLLIISSQLASTNKLRFKPTMISEKPYVVAIKSLASDFEALKKCYSENRLISAQEFDEIRKNMKEEKFVVFQTGVLISTETVITTANIYYNWDTLKIVFKDRDNLGVTRKEIKNIRNLLKSFWTRMLVFADTEVNVEKQSEVHSPWRKIIKESVPRVKRIITNPQRYNVAILTIEPFELSAKVQVMTNLKFFKKNKPRYFSFCEITGYDYERNGLVTQSISNIVSGDKEIMRKCVTTTKNSKMIGQDLKRSFCTTETVFRQGLEDMGFYGAPLICQIDEKPYLIGITSSWNRHATLFADLEFVKVLVSKAGQSSVEIKNDVDDDDRYFNADDDVYYDTNSDTTKNFHHFNTKFHLPLATSSSIKYTIGSYGYNIKLSLLLIYHSVHFLSHIFHFLDYKKKTV